MKVEVPVRIDVVERQPGGPIGLELPGDFLRDLPPERRPHCDFRAVAGEVVAQASAAVEQARYLRAIRHRIAVDQHDVQPDAQIRQRPCPFDCIGRRRRADHEARGTQDAVSVRRLHGGVDGLTEPEIVRRYDQVVQCAGSRRSRRKAKNSTPSRSRRTIISGLRTISATIAAIFGARK